MEMDGIGETDGRDDGMELIVGLGLMVGRAGISPEDGAILCASLCASCCNISSMAAISSSSCPIVVETLVIDYFDSTDLTAPEHPELALTIAKDNHSNSHLQSCPFTTN
jgi:hypothetical protein